MHDIRLLTLYKQHYRDVYDVPLSCGYTCWGYFDGLDICPVVLGSSLFDSLWQANGQKVAAQKGDFSVQNIGLLRYLPDEAGQVAVDAFWTMNARMPFFAVMLIQLDNAETYREATKLAEREGCSQADDPAQKPYCRTIAYGTMDNTDLVLLVHSNSLNELQQSLRRIEMLSQIRYVHSIFAVAEMYLKVCKEEDKIQDTFRGNLCYVDEYIPEIQINVVTDGSSESKSIVHSQLRAYVGRSARLRNATVSDKNGHESFVISLYNIRVANMLELFLPGGFATHQNPVYGKNVYNISTSLLFGRRRLYKLPLQQQSKLPKSSPAKLWCKILMEDYQKKLACAQSNGDESLCSYYQAMFQTLNTMSQYEQFTLSENIFLALIPPLLMLHKQFSNALQSPEAKLHLVEFKESLCQFLEYANMVIYHTIHTDQIFLMVPGYSGTAFSIPIKLNLLFLWLSRKLTEVLNDSNHEYECILTPVMESTPMTHLIEFNSMDQNRLIAVKVSQRLLYSPRELTVILSHEIGHYVGTELRCRKYRLEQLSKLLAYYVAERLLPSELLDGTEPPDQRDAYERWATILRDSLLKHLKQYAKVFQEADPSYSHACVEQLSGACQSWLAEQADLLQSLVLRVPKKLEEELLQLRHSYVRQMKFLSQMQREVQKNWINLLGSNDCENVITEMFEITREVFSDMAALAVLKCEEDEFSEAFSASEGVPMDESNRRARQWFRQDMANRVVFNGEGLNPEYNLPEPSAREEFYQYRATQDYIKAYACKCYGQIQKRLDHPDVRSVRDKIRAFYRSITARGDFSGVDIYAEISRCIGEYGHEIKQLLKDKDPETILGKAPNMQG